MKIVRPVNDTRNRPRSTSNRSPQGRTGKSSPDKVTVAGSIPGAVALPLMDAQTSSPPNRSNVQKRANGAPMRPEMTTNTERGSPTDSTLPGWGVVPEKAKVGEISKSDNARASSPSATAAATPPARPAPIASAGPISSST